jgi:hypothetical protein
MALFCTKEIGRRQHFQVGRRPDYQQIYKDEERGKKASGLDDPFREIRLVFAS